MKKAIKYSILGLAALCTVLLCGGYYMLGYSLKPDDLVSRSRNIAASYDFMYERYPELHPWVDSLMTAGALKDFYIENDRGETLHALYVAAAHPTLKTAVMLTMWLLPDPQTKPQLLYTDIRIMPCAC